MSYKVYTTEAFVLGARDTGESSRVYTLFTRDLGLVQGYAKSVRMVRSKLKHHLDGHAYLRVSFVRGAEYWRIIGAEGLLSPGDNFQHIRAYARVFDLLRRFLGLDDAHTGLFDELANSYKSTSHLIWPSKEAGDLEALLALRTMDHLGYVASNERTYKDEASILASINQALAVSHL